MLKILIADDEPLVRAGIKSVIPWQQHGFEVIGEAENGLEAYNKIIALKPDILITDIKMPQMDGIELLKTIKKDKIHIQSIILSCFDEFDMVREAMKYGAKDYILKLSIEPQKILDVLDEIKQNMAIEEPQSEQIVLDDSDIKYLFIRKLINHGFTSEEQVNNVIHNIRFLASLHHYKLTMFCITKNDMTQLDSDDNKLLYNLLDQICQRFTGHELILIEANRYLLVQNAPSRLAPPCAASPVTLSIFLSVISVGSFVGVSDTLSAVFCPSVTVNDCTELSSAYPAGAVSSL